MSEVEKNARQAFRMTVEDFLGNHRTEEYVTVVANLIQNYKNLCCRMSLKLDVLHSHLDFFCDNVGVLARNTENVSTKTFKFWKRDTKEGGMKS